ncbi:preprotein translocase subunit YajC [Neomicrococcus lactis]|uniref:Preprotein translocase subunit YajC n=1 Tax=Neomicrococcus lactis TaxID=732241 RepID=A0A7W8YA01_9MICC|nr:preprotein translocase subunit YajC [Neomicrococcus lactis]MBB5597647.1 preprotein translocase subunit YajC [Neomicrococcus lactis]
MTSLMVAPLAVVAQAAQQQATGFDPFTLVLFAALALMIFMMFRGRKKAREAQEKIKSSLAPGAQVMTTFGLFGTVVSVDEANNKVQLELSPGNIATVHTQAVGQVVTPDEAAAVAQDENVVVPDDASSLDAAPRTETPAPRAQEDQPLDGTLNDEQRRDGDNKSF